MLTLQTSIRIDDVTGEEIFDFLANPTDRSYREWWPGTHLQFHVLSRGVGYVGDVVYMDEYVGARRLRMKAMVVDAVRGRRLAWRLKKGIELPAQLSIDLREQDGGVILTHTLRAGFGGRGRILDPLLRLALSRSFAADLDEHVRREFPLLRERLAAARAPSVSTGSPA